MTRSIGKVFIVVGFVLSVVAFQNCSGGFVTLPLASTEAGSAGIVVESDPLLKQQSVAILQAKCAACHGATSSGNVTNILDLGHLVDSGLIVPGDATKGRLIGSIEDQSMPTNRQNAVTPGELQTLKSWILSVRVVDDSPPPVAGPIIPPGMTVVSDPALKTAAMRTLQVNCAGCHQSNSAGGIGKILDVDHLVSTGLVVMGDGSKGRLIGSIEDRSMPKQGTRLVMSSASLLGLQQWIRSMTLAPLAANPPAPALPPLGPTYASISANILVPKCTSCHSAAGGGGIRYETYAQTMRTVVANNAANSDMYTESASGSMPESPYQSLSTEELTAMRTWINNGALNN